MGAVTQVASAILLALVPPHGEPKQEARSTTGNEVVRRATITSTSELKAFLRMNPEEGFDIEAINAVDTHALLKDARVEKELLLATVRNAEALLPRVRAETEDPLLVGAILSDKTLAWYRKSTADPDWTEFAPIRWGGIFFESRAPGGRLRRKLSTRLVDLINDCVNAAGTTAVLRAGFSGMLRGSKHMKNAVQYALGSKRPRLTQQVAQAYLDDLAANPRGGDTPVPLAHLSDVAKRMGTAEVNNTLAELFHAQSNRVLIVLDPRFHPGMNSVFIQVVPAKNPEEPSTYDLVQVEPGKSREGSASPEASKEPASASPWDQKDITDKDWLKLLKALEKKKGRLEAPPAENHRDRPGYVVLRDLLLRDAAARKAFLVVHWKGRPGGLSLLAELLTQRTWTPEVDTDADYLEAELDHLAQQPGNSGSADKGWAIGHSWKVNRTVGADSVRAYTASGPSAD